MLAEIAWCESGEYDGHLIANQTEGRVFSVCSAIGNKGVVDIVLRATEARRLVVYGFSLSALEEDWSAEFIVSSDPPYLLGGEDSELGGQASPECQKEMRIGEGARFSRREELSIIDPSGSYRTAMRFGI